MLKFFFWILLLANAALFGYQQIYLDMSASSGREPDRVSNQLNADKIRLLPAGAVNRAPAVAPVAAAPQAGPVACIEIGNFNVDDAARFQTMLAELSLGERVTQRSNREILSYMVYIPSQGSKEAAARKAGELRQLGISDFYVIQDDPNHQWGISLGVFKLEEGARAHLVEMTRRGVRSARIGPHSMTAATEVFQLRDLDADMKAGVDRLMAEFPRQQMRACAAA